MRPHYHLLVISLLLLPAACSSNSNGGTGGSTGNGGATGGGGSSGLGGNAAGTGGRATGGSTGTAGSSGNGGTTASGGRSGSTGGASGTTGGCASLPLCDDFESTAANGPPSAAKWTLISNGGGSDTATIDSIGAHGSGRSVKVTSGGRFYLRNSSVIGTLGPVVHARFYARFMTELPGGHGAIAVTHPTPADQFTQNNELRFGSQDNVFHWNTDVDVNIPEVSPQGDVLSFRPAALTWYCIELTINSGNGHLNVSVDGTDIPGLTEDGVATDHVDNAWVASTPSLMRYTAFGDFNVGWTSYGGGAMTIWFDDVALSSAPIGCQN